MKTLIVTPLPFDLWRKHLGNISADFAAADTPDLANSINKGAYEAIHLELPPDMPAPISLRLVQLASAGYNQLLAHPWSRQVPHIATSAGFCAHYIAEHITTCVLSHEKQFARHAEHHRHALWPNRSGFGNRSPRGKTVAIIGYGAIGRETARLLHALGLRVLAVNRDGQPSRFSGWLPQGIAGDPDGALPAAWHPLSRVHDAVAVADYIVLSIALNGQTEGLADRAFFQAMKPNAVLINIARGGLVREDDLATALDTGTPSHAFLDVFAEEPLPPGVTWWAHPQVTVTPHISGVMPIEEIIPHEAALFVENLRRVACGERVLNAVPAA